MIDSTTTQNKAEQKEYSQLPENINPQQMFLKGYETAINKIAKELHDNVCNKLLVLEYQFEESIPESLLKELIAIRDLIRKISHDMYNPQMKHLPLSEVIELYFSEIELVSSFSFSYFVDKRIDKLNFAELERIALYRIIQECITNIMKHSYATRVQTTLYVDDDVLFMILEDDGVGFDHTKVKNGLGMDLLTNRAELLAASIDICSEPDKGTIVCLNIPI